MSKAIILIFTVWSNAPDGHQTVLLQRPMEESVCLRNQAEFWSRPFETVGYDELGALPAYDAACIPLDS